MRMFCANEDISYIWLVTKHRNLFHDPYGKIRYFRTPGKFGHTFASSGNPDETAPYEASHQDFHSLLSKLFIPSNN